MKAHFLVIVTLILVSLDSHALGQSASDEIGALTDKVAMREEIMGVVKSGILLPFGESELSKLITRDIQTHADLAEDKLPEILKVEVWSRYDDLVESKARKYDPDGSLQLRQWTSAGPSSEAAMAPIRSQLESSFQAFWKTSGNAVTRSYQRARRSISDHQLAPLIDALNASSQELPDGFFPTTNQIESVVVQPGQREPLKDSVYEKLRTHAKDFWKETPLLRETSREMALIADRIVAVGIGQHDDQLRTLERPPANLTPAAIEREFLVRMQAYVLEKQRQKHVDDTLPKKIYPIFQSSKRAASDQAASLLDRWIVDELDNQRSEQRLLPIVKALESSIVSQIENNIAAHHQRAESIDALKKHFMPNLENDARKAVAENVRANVKEAAMRQRTEDNDSDISKVLETANERIRLKPIGLKSALSGHMDKLDSDFTKLVDDVRAKIAINQVRQHSKLLHDGLWLPTDAEMLAAPHDAQIDEAWLRKHTELWSIVPTMPTALLDETWTILRDKATEALRLGHRTLARQSKLVIDVKPELTSRIQIRSSEQMANWLKEYRQEVLSRWRNTSSRELADKYPDLLPAVDDQIKGAVVDLLLEIRQRQIVDKLINDIAQHVKPDAASTGDLTIIIGGLKDKAEELWGNDELADRTKGKLLPKVEEYLAQVAAEALAKSAIVDRQQAAKALQIRLAAKYLSTDDCKTQLLDRWKVQPPRTNVEVSPYISHYESWVLRNWNESTLSDKFGINQLLQDTESVIEGNVWNLLKQMGINVTLVTNDPLASTGGTQDSSAGSGDGTSAGSGDGTSGGAGDGIGTGPGGTKGIGSAVATPASKVVSFLQENERYIWLAVITILVAALVYYHFKYLRPAARLQSLLDELGSRDEQFAIISLLVEIKRAYEKDTQVALRALLNAVPKKSPFVDSSKIELPSITSESIVIRN